MNFDCYCIGNLFTPIITFFGFTITCYTLWRNNKERSISNVISLKKELRKYDDVYFKLLPNSKDTYSVKSTLEAKEYGRLISYIGLFEVAYQMIVSGSLSKKEFKIYFLYRLNNIVSNDVVKNILLEDKANWESLFTLIELFGLNID